MVKPLYERVVITFNHKETAEYYYMAEISQYVYQDERRHAVCSTRFKDYRDKGYMVLLAHDGFVVELPLANVTQIVWTGEYSERDNSRKGDARKPLPDFKDE